MRSMAHLGLKKISIHSILLATATAAALTLAGCGGGDSAATGGSGSTVTGQFVDATVVGLGYKCGTSSTLSGNTDANGQFTCKSGEAVAFYVGGILLGSVPSAQALVTPLDLVGAGATPGNTTVNNIVRFLMSISSTPATGGTLTIDPAVVTAATGKTIDFTKVLAADLDTLINAIKPAGATVATTADATAHMSNSLNALFAGAYSGNFSGSFSGTWNITIDAKGVVSGTATDSTGGTGVVTGSMATTMGTGSTYAFSGTGGGTPWVGTLNLNTRQFSGTWDDGAGAKGTFTGVTATTPVTTPGASGGSLTLAGTHNAGKASFTPADPVTCSSVNTGTLLNVNCVNPAAGDSLALQLIGTPAVGNTYTVNKSGTGSSPNTVMGVDYIQILNGAATWSSAGGGTVKITALSATSATLLFTGVGLYAVTATTPATGNMTLNGSITVGIR